MILYAILALALQTAEVAPSASLAYRFPPGARAVYTLERNAEYAGMMNGREQSVSVFERAILEPDSEGRRRVQIILKSAKASYHMKMSHIRRPVTAEYDSQKSVLKIDASDEMRPYLSSQYVLYSQLIDQPVIVTLGDGNSVQAAEGVDEIVQKTMTSRKDGKAGTFNTGYSGTTGVPGLINIVGSVFGALSQGSDKRLKKMEEILLKRTIIWRVTGLASGSATAVSWLALPGFDPGRAVQPGETWRLTWAGDSAALEELDKEFDRIMADMSKNVSSSNPVPRPPQRLVDVQMKSVEGNNTFLTYSTVSSGESASYMKENESGEVIFDTSLGLIRSLDSRAEITMGAGMGDGIQVKASSLLRLDQFFPPPMDSRTSPAAPPSAPLIKFQKDGVLVSGFDWLEKK